MRSYIVEIHGLVDYEKAWEYQRSLVEKQIENPFLCDRLILLEHPSVYTLGTGSSKEFVKFQPEKSNKKLYRVERGGEVTYHCQGQLVGYPILNLRRHQQDLHWYLRQIETVIIEVLREYGLKGYRIPKLTGVWLEGKKVAAIGIKVKRWITMHGFAINVCCDLKGFDNIVPCGIVDRSVGSLAEFIPDITVNKVRKDTIHHFSQVFQINPIQRWSPIK